MNKRLNKKKGGENKEKFDDPKPLVLSHLANKTSRMIQILYCQKKHNTSTCAHLPAQGSRSRGGVFAPSQPQRPHEGFV